MTRIREFEQGDENEVWAILKPIFRAGDTYAIDRDVPREKALKFWASGDHTCFVVEEGNAVLGTYYICPNQQGGGAHVCNCGFATAPKARGRGLARTMLEHAMETAKSFGFRAMQFNFVVATNTGALKIWREYGFEDVGRLPKAFLHPKKGYVDACVLYKSLVL